MKILQEITVWPDTTKNHTYHVNNAGKLVAYIPASSSELTTFTVPKMFDTRARKFKTLQVIPAPGATVRTVTGSNGALYTIRDGMCDCPGFRFRGSCKHVQ